MGIFLFLLSFPAAIAAWVFIAKKLKASGKNAAVRHFAGVAAGFFVWVFVIMIGIKADEGKTEEEIINETFATTNCGECYNEFKEYVEKYNKNKKEI